MTILKTRLYRPTFNEDLLLRKKLLVELERKQYVSLIPKVAGACYGKALLMSQFQSVTKYLHPYQTGRRPCIDHNI